MNEPKKQHAALSMLLRTKCAVFVDHVGRCHRCDQHALWGLFLYSTAGSQLYLALESSSITTERREQVDLGVGVYRTCERSTNPGVTTVR